MKRIFIARTVVLFWALGAAACQAAEAGPPAVAEGAAVFPAERWEKVAPGDVGLDESKLAKARAYALTGGGAGVVVRGGRVAMAWGDTRQRFDLKSTTKSFGATMLGVAIADGKVRLGDRAVTLLPGFGVPPGENERWAPEVTVHQLATHTAGFEKPGGLGRLLFRPGTLWHYSDGGPNWLADCLTHLYRRDLKDVMFERVFAPIGITERDLRWRENQYRDKTLGGVKRREFGAGIHGSVEAMARLGYLHRRGGRWRGEQIVPGAFVERVGKTPRETAGLAEREPEGEHGDASRHYGLLWWNNADGALGAGVPTDAYWAWGLHDSLIVVVPSLDVVVARAGKGWEREKGAGHYAVLRPFVGDICAAVVETESRERANGAEAEQRR